jgi:hypothetical protein
VHKLRDKFALALVGPQGARHVQGVVSPVARCTGGEQGRCGVRGEHVVITIFTDELLRVYPHVMIFVDKLRGVNN